MVVGEPGAELLLSRLRHMDLVEDQQLQLEGDAIADHVVAAIDAERLALAVKDFAGDPALDHFLKFGIGGDARFVLVEVVDEGLA